MTDKPKLIDRIYEAAVIPELWPEVCEQLASAVGAYSAAILTVDQMQAIRWVCSPVIQEPLERYSKSEVRFENPRPARSIQMYPLSFARDVDVMTLDEIVDDPVYDVFLRPLGLGWSMGAVMPEPSGHTLIFDFTGRFEDGPFASSAVDTLNDLKGDLARAALIASRLVFRQAQNIASTLAMIGLPTAVVGEGNRVMAMNDEMEALNPRIRAGAGDRLSLDSPSASLLLSNALEQVRRADTTTVQSIPLAAANGGGAIILHVVPVRRNARDIFSRSLAVVIATPVGQVGPPDMRVLSGLFDLTPGEARVARELASGASLESVSLTLGLKIETVRTYLKRIFVKTGTRRQAELTHMLSGLGRVPA